MGTEVACAFAKAEPIENGKTSWLQYETGAYGLGLVELIEDFEVMTQATQSKSSGQPSRASAANPDPQFFQASLDGVVQMVLMAF